MKKLSIVAVSTVALTSSALLCLGLASAALSRGLGSSDVASWVQAIGATLGLGIAIWIPYKEKIDAARNAELSRRETIIRVCKALQDELMIEAEGLDSPLFTQMTRGSGEIFNVEVVESTSLFPVYGSLVSRLVDIDDEDTRRAVIIAYGSATSLHDLLALNTAKLRYYSEIHRASRSGPGGSGVAQFADQEDFARAQLINLRKEIRTKSRHVESDLKDALECLQNTIDTYST